MNVRKQGKFAFFAGNVAACLVPSAFWQIRGNRLLATLSERPDRKEIEARAAYCCRLADGAALPADAPRVEDLRFGKKHHVYYFDMRRHLRYVPRGRRFLYIPGDVTKVPDAPAFVKSRPIAGDNANAVLLKLNAVRHFVFVDGDAPFRDKDDVAVFRGKVWRKPKRVALFQRWFGANGLDLGETDARTDTPEWARPHLSIGEQLRHKFIFCIEGNDVSSNLKWVFSSNSVAVMPRPEYETWFQEGLLVPGVHYIEVRPDFADVQEKLDHYRSHPEACERILDAAHAWAARFRDPIRERLVSLLVHRRYFAATGQAAF